MDGSYNNWKGPWKPKPPWWEGLKSIAYLLGLMGGLSFAALVLRWLIGGA